MKNLFKVSILVLGLGLGFSQGASASVNVLDSVNMGAFTEGDYTYSGNIAQDGSFSQLINFTISQSDFFASGSNVAANDSFTLRVGSGKSAHNVSYLNSTNIDQLSFTLSKLNSNYSATFSDSNPLSVALSSGAYQVLVQGNAIGSNVYNNALHPVLSAGQYQMDFSVSPVPEAEEWAMMLVGFGLIGVAAGKQKEDSFKIK